MLKRAVQGALMLAVLGVVLWAASTSSQTETPTDDPKTLTWTGRVPDADGVPRDIEFKGTVSDGIVVGSIFMEGNELKLSGTIGPDGAVEGLVTRSDGAELGLVSMRSPLSRIASADTEFAYDLGSRQGAGVVEATSETADRIRAAGAAAAQP